MPTFYVPGIKPQRPRVTPALGRPPPSPACLPVPSEALGLIAKGTLEVNHEINDKEGIDRISDVSSYSRCKCLVLFISNDCKV